LIPAIVIKTISPFAYQSVIANILSWPASSLDKPDFKPCGFIYKSLKYVFTLVGRISACATCHGANGVEVGIDKNSPLLCGLEVDWDPGQ
jgi:hypothetical protein